MEGTVGVQVKLLVTEVLYKIGKVSVSVFTKTETELRVSRRIGKNHVRYYSKKRTKTDTESRREVTECKDLLFSIKTQNKEEISRIVSKTVYYLQGIFTNLYSLTGLGS